MTTTADVPQVIDDPPAAGDLDRPDALGQTDVAMADRPDVAVADGSDAEVTVRDLIGRRPTGAMDDEEAASARGPDPSERLELAGRGGRGREIADTIATAWALRRGHVIAVATILLLAVVGAGIMVVRDRPVRESVHEPLSRAAVVTPAGRSSGTAAASPAPSPTPLVVHVAGKVRKPGVLRLPPGSRVVDAVSAAGGALSGVDLSSLNLARPLADGEQVLVGVAPPPGAAPGAAGSAPGTAPASDGAPVDLNTATLETLEDLPGVGPVLAQRILEFRTSHGRFSSVDELQDVTGIGERKFADLEARVTVS